MSEKDRLQEMLDDQREFSSYWTPYDRLDSMDEAERERYAKDLLLKVYEEVSEVVGAVHNYSWRTRQEGSENVAFQLQETEQQRADVLEEIVDAFKYLLNVGMCYGLTPDKFYAAFIDKSTLNWARRAEVQGKPGDTRKL